MVVTEADKSVTTSSRPRLYRGIITSLETELPLTCGSLQASRLAWLRDEKYAFATGTSVYTVSTTNIDKIVSDEREKATNSSIAQDYLVPSTQSNLHAVRIAAHSTHRLEIQSCISGNGRLATTDPYGRTVVSCTNDTSSALTMHTPPDITHGAAGWTGAAFAPTGTPNIAITRSGFRDILLFDGEVCVRTIHTSFTPAAVTFRDGNTIALAEGPFLSLYDLRSHTQRPAISRRVCSTGSLIALYATSDESVFITTGADRAVNALDAYNLAPRGRWGPCLKYEAAAIVPICNDRVAVASIDNEVAVGNPYSPITQRGVKRTLMLSGAAALAGGNRRRCGFRADVRIVGIASDGNGVVAALSENGSLYVLRDA